MLTLSQVSNNARPGSPDQCEFHRAQTEIPTQAQQKSPLKPNRRA